MQEQMILKVLHYILIIADRVNKESRSIFLDEEFNFNKIYSGSINIANTIILYLRNAARCFVLISAIKKYKGDFWD